MSDATDSDTRAQRFNDAVRTFEPPLPRRQAKLMPFKDGIIELRQKGASLNLIRELLATIDVAVSNATIARFVAEITDTATPPRQRQRFNRKRGVVQNADRRRPIAVPLISAPSTASPPGAPTPMETPRAARPRTRGPRIADPHNL
ncbi:MAG: hypothetical protein WA183_19310 [Chthoniobacterales bacterium]